MFQQFRHIAPYLILILMGVFAVCLVADECGDIERAWADMQIEATAELEPIDFEWDEDCTDNGDGRICEYATLGGVAHYFASEDTCAPVNSCSLLSDTLKRGQVRRYAPRKGTIISPNHIQIAMNPVEFMAICFFRNIDISIYRNNDITKSLKNKTI